PAASSYRGSAHTTPASIMPVVQRMNDDSHKSESAHPPTTVMRVAPAVGHGNTGSLPAPGRTDRILPLLPARQLSRLVEPSTPVAPPNRVVRAVWRRPNGDGRNTIRPPDGEGRSAIRPPYGHGRGAAQQVGQSPNQPRESHGASPAAMASTQP